MVHEFSDRGFPVSIQNLYKFGVGVKVSESIYARGKVSMISISCTGTVIK